MNPTDCMFEFNDEFSFEGVPCLLNTHVPLPPLPFQPSAQNVSSSDPSFAHSSQYSEKSSDSDSVVSLSPTCEAASFQTMPAFQLKPCQQEQQHHHHHQQQQQQFTPPASPTPQRDDVDYKTLYFAAQEHIQALSHTVHELELKIAELQSCVGTPVSSPESLPRSRASSSSSHHLSVNLSDSINSPTSSEEFSPETPRRCFMASQELPRYHPQQQQQQQQQQQRSAAAQQFHARASPEPAQQQQQQQQVHQPQQSAAFSLEFIPNIPAVWYADRPLPSLKIRAQGIEGIANPTDFRVQISMIDGLGEDASDKLGGPASSHGFLFPVQSDCEAELTGMRFSAVSSKWGGHFKVVAKLVGPAHILGSTPVQIFSDRIQVLSYRLYNSPKVDFAKLSGKDSLSKIKGIGSLYAKRFAHLGIKTVADLAALGDSGNEFDQTLDHLRKERGALTKAKFTDYINQAREIVSRERKEQGQPLMAPVPQPQSESSKKRSLFSDSSSPQNVASTPSPQDLVHHDLLMGGGPSSLGMSLAMAANQMDSAKRPRTADALWFPAN